MKNPVGETGLTDCPPLRNLDALSRELGATAGAIAQWHEQFLSSGQAGLKSRAADEREDELARLRAKVCKLMMENEQLRELKV